MKIGIVGLGYVGLPLAVAFAKRHEVIGLDINQHRIEELRLGIDSTLEISSEQLQQVKSELHFTDSIDDLKDITCFIVTVPTPIDQNKQPDLRPLIGASKAITSVLKKGDIVVYESTVYPGATEEVCVPILEASGLVFNEDFFVGYSPERINPGDKKHTVEKILKVTSGSTPEVAEKVDQLYASVIEAGTYKAESIKIAEAAKVIENSQRDINIAFVNELSKIFDKLDIDTYAVLEAAGTKWNFLPFKPGLVGGHCIGVDPYYLAEKAKSVGYQPEIILAGRRLNDNMGTHVAQKLAKALIKKKVASPKILVLGITFKENCPDIRNSQVINVIRELQDYNFEVHVHDPWASSEEVKHEYNLNLIPTPALEDYDGIVLAVSHKEFESLDFRSKKGNSIIFDVKGILPKGVAELSL